MIACLSQIKSEYSKSIHFHCTTYLLIIQDHLGLKLIATSRGGNWATTGQEKAKIAVSTDWQLNLKRQNPRQRRLLAETNNLSSICERASTLL